MTEFQAYWQQLQSAFPLVKIDELRAFHYWYNGATVGQAVDGICEELN